MGFSFNDNIPVLTVFLQGLASFFSPCVLPLLPLYIGYLSGGTGRKGEDGRMHYDRGRVLGHTFCFVIGVSFAFFALGLGVSALGQFFQSGQKVFSIAGGVLVILFGLYQLGVFGTFSFFGKERRLPVKLDTLAMSPLTALIMGFTFSFAWTPCVGPALTSVLLMAASAQSQMKGFLLIGVYTLGFVLPFLAAGLFTTSLLEFFKTHRNVVNYAVKIGGVLMLIMGLWMIGSGAGMISGSNAPGSGVPAPAESSLGGNAATGEAVSGETDSGNDAASDEKTSESSGQEDGDTSSETASGESEERPKIPAVDFTLTDQFGNTHSLSDYKGKTVFLNFWATWCPPCKAEMPEIQTLYENRETQWDEELVVLGVAAPGLGQEGSEEDIKKFLEENGYTYPVLMDTDGTLFYSYGITAFPTTFMIDKNGDVFGYVSGQLSLEIMEDIVRQTMEGVE